MATDWGDVEWGSRWADWLDKWAPRCATGNPQRPCSCLAYREPESGLLQLRVAMLKGAEDICEVIVHEDQDSVYVRVLACYDKNDDGDERCGYVNCLVDIYLENPLSGRTVIDVERDRALPAIRATARY